MGILSDFENRVGGGLRALVLKAGCAALAAVLVLPFVPSQAGAEPLSPAMTHAQVVTATKIAATQAIVPAGQYPLYTNANGGWVLSVPRRWVSGMLPGNLWLEYQRTGAEPWRMAAEARGVAIRPYATDTRFHDIGFMFLGSDRHDWRLTGDLAARDRLLVAARSLATRYDPNVRMVRTLDTSPGFWVYNDTMMNIELLYWSAANGGGPAMAAKASEHSLRTITDFLRSDGSSFHYVVYNETTGAVLSKGQGQGFEDDSTWSRGQAWIIYGLAVAYRETGDARFAEGAWKASRYWIDNVPADHVPYWDFNAPDIPDEPRDSSAAAIVASAFVELGRLDPDPVHRTEYLDVARQTLESLSRAPYLNEDPAFAAVLAHGTHAKMINAFDHGTSWGDYYFAEALLRLRTHVVRLGGPDRYATAVRVSQTAFGHSAAVVIVSGATYPDALTASGLAGGLKAPVLLTRPNALPAETAAEIRRLGATRAVIVGGTAAVGDSVAASLSALPGVAVERIAGADRYATAAAVATVVAAADDYDGEVFVVRGDDFADALAVAPIAYAEAMPVLLTRRTTLPASGAAILASNETTHAIFVGGPAVLAPELERSISNEYGVATTRRSGSDRYSTAAALGEWALTSGRARSSFAGVATGLGWADALAGGAAIGSRNGVLLLTRPGHLPGEASAFLARYAGAGTDVHLFGGEAAVSGVAENELRRALPEQ